MGQILHGSARTTEEVRQASIRSLAQRHGVNPKTVAKWKRRTSTADARMGPKAPRSTVLSQEEEAIIIAFRKHTLLLLDDCLYALQHLTRLSLHRCLPRHGIFTVAGGRRRQTPQEELQGLPDRLLPYRHRRSPYRRRQALPLHRHRPHLQDQHRPHR